MSPLRVILVMIEPPLPFGNAAARWYYVLLKGLVERGHRVTTLATCSRPEEMAEARALFPAARYDLRCYPHPERWGPFAKWETLRRPYSYMFSPDFRRDLDRELAGSFDVLHLEQLWSGWLGLRHTRRAVLNLHYLFSIDQGLEPPSSLPGRLRHALTCRAERRLLRSYPTVITLTPRLGECVRRVAPGARVHTVPFGLDPSLYPFRPEGPANDRPVVALIGSFNWAPTYSAGVRLITRLWPEIKRRVPDARLQIVGREARKMLGQFADVPDLTIHENVPDIQPYFAGTDVLVYAPAAGSGMKVKVLEAFALGTATVTTADGVEGLPAEDAIHAGIREDDQGLIARTVQLLQDREARRRQRLAARALVERYCGPRPTLDALEVAYADLADRPPPVRPLPAPPMEVGSL